MSNQRTEERVWDGIIKMNCNINSFGLQSIEDLHTFRFRSAFERLRPGRSATADCLVPERERFLSLWPFTHDSLSPRSAPCAGCKLNFVWLRLPHMHSAERWHHAAIQARRSDDARLRPVRCCRRQRTAYMHALASSRIIHVFNEMVLGAKGALIVQQIVSETRYARTDTKTENSPVGE